MASEVKPYTLSPEELQELWKRTGPPGTINGKPARKKKPIATYAERPELTSEKQRARAKKSHAGRPKSKGPNRDYVLREIAQGKTIVDDGAPARDEAKYAVPLD